MNLQENERWKNNSLGWVIFNLGAGILSILYAYVLHISRGLSAQFAIYAAFDDVNLGWFSIAILLNGLGYYFRVKKSDLTAALGFVVILLVAPFATYNQIFDPFDWVTISFLLFAGSVIFTIYFQNEARVFEKKQQEILIDNAIRNAIRKERRELKKHFQLFSYTFRLRQENQDLDLFLAEPQFETMNEQGVDYIKIEKAELKRIIENKKANGDSGRFPLYYSSQRI